MGDKSVVLPIVIISVIIAINSVLEITPTQQIRKQLTAVQEQLKIVQEQLKEKQQCK